MEGKTPQMEPIHKEEGKEEKARRRRQEARTAPGGIGLVQGFARIPQRLAPRNKTMPLRIDMTPRRSGVSDAKRPSCRERSR